MIRYKEEMWFPNLGTGETYRFRFLGGLLLLAAAADIMRITRQPILMMVFGVFGFVLTANGAAREIKRRSRALTQAGDFKERAVKTTGRIVSYDGGVKRYSFSKFPDGPINSHGFFFEFTWSAQVEYERKDGTVERAYIRGLNKSPKRFLRKEVTVYYSGKKIYVEF